jgi:acyl CoA:acetate/3-ketoacid CoA transferase beta subunit
VGGSGLTLIELAPGVTLAEAEARTDAAFVARVPE